MDHAIAFSLLYKHFTPKSKIMEVLDILTLNIQISDLPLSTTEIMELVIFKDGLRHHKPIWPLNLTIPINLIPGVLQWVHNYRNYLEFAELLNPGIKTLISATLCAA